MVCLNTKRVEAVSALSNGQSQTNWDQPKTRCEVDIRELSGTYSLLKLSTMIAPIEAGIVITINRFNAITGGNLFSEYNTSATTRAAIK